MCQARAGGIPCDLVTFHQANNEQEFYHHIEKIIKYVQNFCNPEWTRKSNILLDRLHKAIFCPAENGYGGNGYGSNGYESNGYENNDGYVKDDYKPAYKPPSYNTYKCGDYAHIVDGGKYSGGKVCKCDAGYSLWVKNKNWLKFS